MNSKKKCATKNEKLVYKVKSGPAISSVGCDVMVTLVFLLSQQTSQRNGFISVYFCVNKTNVLSNLKYSLER